jgi:hypothetical protein
MLSTHSRKPWWRNDTCPLHAQKLPFHYSQLYAPQATTEAVMALEGTLKNRNCRGGAPHRLASRLGTRKGTVTVLHWSHPLAPSPFGAA